MLKEHNNRVARLRKNTTHTFIGGGLLGYLLGLFTAAVFISNVMLK